MNLGPMQPPRNRPGRNLCTRGVWFRHIVDTCRETSWTPTREVSSGSVSLRDAVVLEGRAVAQEHGVFKSWVQELVARFRAGGNEALQALQGAAVRGEPDLRPRLRIASSSLARSS